MSTIESRIKKVIADQIGKKEDDIALTARIRDELDVDSLDEVEIIMALEEEFDIEIADEDAEKWETVHDIVVYVIDKTA